MRILSFLLLALGAVGILLSVPLLGFSALGFLGILADVGPAENQEMGIQSLLLGLLPLIGGLLMCVAGFVMFVLTRPRAEGETVSGAVRRSDS